MDATVPDPSRLEFHAVIGFTASTGAMKNLQKFRTAKLKAPCVV
eukprot:gene31058-24845_t